MHNTRISCIIRMTPLPRGFILSTAGVLTVLAGSAWTHGQLPYGTSNRLHDSQPRRLRSRSDGVGESTRVAEAIAWGLRSNILTWQPVERAMSCLLLRAEAVIGSAAT
jgi:hypothetical protein